ncbi:MAG: adenylyltransferase/cytidyltransferase family protein [Dehalococcoidia bacterium]|nr:adenylyltransferase/cytidyltransferase family protein [Dehalococcoidia bacterium]
MKIVAVSGGFDPLHIGHIQMINEAAKYGKVIVILNNDHFLLRQKGYIFMPQEERKEILESLKNVSRVVIAVDEDESVCKTLEVLKPDIFANGGDKTPDTILESEVCNRLGIKMLFGVGGKKIQWTAPRAKT